MSDPWFNNWKQYTDRPRVEDAFKTQADRSDTLTEEEQNELARWFLAESEWYAARREWEQNGYFNELLAQQEELARWLLAEQAWQARQDGRWHYKGCVEDGQVLRWLLAEYRYHLVIQEWLLSEQRYLRWIDRTRILSLATQVNKWETWSREGELEPQEANDIYRWLIREAQFTAQFTVSQAYDIYRWLLAEKGHYRDSIGLCAYQDAIHDSTVLYEKLQIALWLLAETKFRLDQDAELATRQISDQTAYLYEWLLAEKKWHSTKAVGHNYEAGYDDGYNKAHTT